MRILLLGGSGLLGTAMRRLWNGVEITAPDEAALDITSADAVARAVDETRPDWIVNCAAYNNVDGAEGAGRELADRLNAEAPTRLAEIAAAKNIPLIHFSSDYVFAGDREEPYAEADAPAPRSAYADSKRRGEIGVLARHPGAYLIRTSRLYGRKSDLPGAKRSFVELILADAEKAAQVLVNGGEISAPTYVDDLVRHIEQHILRIKPSPGIYHMTNGGGASWYDWAVEIGKILQLPTAFKRRDPESLKRPARRPAHSVLVSTKLPAMRPWQEALRAFLTEQPPSFQQKWIATGIEGSAVELQPRIGDADGAVLHMLPGGVKSAEGFGPELLDIYAFTARGKDKTRGGHYHLNLDELFFPMSGTALWILSDFRESSPTKGKTIGLVLGIDRGSFSASAYLLPPTAYFLSDGTLPRLRVPAGVYHAVFPLTDERVMYTAFGTTPYDKDDYRYPTLEEIPAAKKILKESGLTT